MQWKVANMGRLDGKVAAVTGGASGIGEATVRRFVAEGASVAFCDRDGGRGRRVAAELETAGAKVAFTHADVGSEAACLDFINGAAQKFGCLDILINNAGIRKYEKVDEASAASWNEILSVNLMSYDAHISRCDSDVDGDQLNNDCPGHCVALMSAVCNGSGCLDSFRGGIS